MSESWHTYPKIYALGHAALNELLSDEILVEEKVDGSQFSFGIFDGVLRFKSKGRDQTEAPDAMFELAIRNVNGLKHLLHDGWTYRAELLNKPKHNSLFYDRVPVANLIIFDINTDHEKYLDYEAKVSEAARVGFETVPMLYRGHLDKDRFEKLLDRESVLGGTKIEGVVIKNYTRFGRDKKALMGKFVSERFKEVHSKEWKKSNPPSKSILQLLGEKYKSEARWEKGVQHLQENGELENSPKDIGLLVKEIPADIKSECEEQIKADLFKWAWPHIARSVMRGMPEWYKEKLANSQFND